MSEYLDHFKSSLPHGMSHRIHAESMNVSKKRTSEKSNRASKSTSTAQSFIQRGPSAALLLTLLIVLVIVGLRPYLLPARHHDETPGNTVRSKYLQLAIPVNRKYDVDLCKTVLSAQVLNYPVPVIVPWGNTSDNAPVAKEKRMYHKVARIYSYLSTLPPEADDAMTILLDGPDTWFQLRPEMLLQSYYRTIRTANRRLKDTYGAGIEQKVIFAAHHDCGSSDPADSVCSAVPDAPKAGRPKYMGHGAMVGPTKDILAIVRRALNRLETTQAAPSKLLPIYSEIFAEQELQRQLRRKNGSGPQIRGKRQANTGASEAEIKVAADLSAELGIGLDYENELGFSAAAGAEPQWQKPKVLLDELQAGIPPFWTVSGLEPGLPHSTSWSELELLTVRDTSIPAMIHHWPTVSMGGKDSTGQRREWWPRLWLAQYARTLFTAAERLPATVVAQVQDNEAQEIQFWNRQPSHNKAGVWTPDWKFFHYQEMCAADAIWQDVFRDDRGPWLRTEWF